MGWIDTEQLKRDHPIDAVVARYGVEIRRSGRVCVGRCPFHVDGGRPNFTVYSESRSWFCYRCRLGGDVITFVQRIEGLGFRDAVARLEGELPSPPSVPRLPRPALQHRRARPRNWGQQEHDCLAGAVELYHNRLLSDSAALAYIEGRGIDRATIERYQIGYASGDELVAYLRWRHLSTGAALRIGLLASGARETMAGRVVVPEIRSGQPVWLVGRALPPEDGRPKYLGLPGPKPLLGWEDASTEQSVILTEGVMDWLVLRTWGYPALALVGTHVRLAALSALAQFRRIYLCLDGDEPGQAAAEELARRLGDRAVFVALPNVKDVAELALRPDGRAIFARALQRSDLPQAA